ncbi:Card1-like endonuclease domain-containing protein [Vibrio owensii]|uniref:Card1-like endonuclease domain-containing protein n=1 Tax=Vibrio owensii TaxID=696485 RepID=UPI0038CE3717
MSIFIGLIDRDPIRLLTPILDKRSPCEHAIFLGDKNEFHMFLRLEQVLSKNSVTSEFFEIPEEPSVKSIKESALTLAQRISIQNTPIFFNASCGLRHRLLSLYEIFRQYHWPVFIVEPFSDKLCWMHPEEKQSTFVQDHINLEDYLSVFGAECERQEHPLITTRDELIDIGSQWVKSALMLGSGLATLNYLATKCRKEHVLSVKLSDVQRKYVELKTLIDGLCKVELASYLNGTLTFNSEDARRFANGGWLELLVDHYIKELGDQIPTIQDKARSLHVHRKVNDEAVKNEIDIATIVNNKLHLIECKTKSMGTGGDDTLYKLESLKDLLGGFQARAMLISFRPLKYTDVSRAEDLGLALIGPKELPHLYQHLKNWFNNAGGYE